MTIHATGTATFTDWHEDPPHTDPTFPRLAHARMRLAYDGDLVATSTCHYALRYGPDGAGDTVGYEEVTGRLGEAEGTFVLRHEGSFHPERGVEVRTTVVPGSGTGALAGITGHGAYGVGNHGREWPWRLELDRGDG